MLANSQPKAYCLTKKVCPTCLQADAVQLPGTASMQRFCHQCGKFEDIDLFDGERRCAGRAPGSSCCMHVWLSCSQCQAVGSSTSCLPARCAVLTCRTCRDRLAKRRKQAACCLSRDSTPMEHQEADTDSAPMAGGAAWSCYGYGADTVACSALDGSASDTSGMLADLDLQRHLEQSLAACAVPSTDEPGCQLPQLQLPQGFMGMPAACSAALSPSDAADDSELDFVAAAMQEELQQCLQEQQQQAAAAAFSSCDQQPLCSGFQAPRFTSYAVQPGSLAVDARPWCDTSNNSSTLPVVDVCSGLVSQPVAAHAAGAYCAHSSSNTDATALARQARLQELLAKRRELEEAAAELQALQGALATARLVGPSAQLQRLTSMPAQFPAGPEHMCSSTPTLSAHMPGQSGGLFRVPTASSGVLAATVQEVHMRHELVPDCGAAVVQKLDHLQSQLEQVAAQFSHLRQVAAGNVVQATPSSNASTSTLCPVSGVSMF